jgi:hypothetical protein
MWQKTYDHNGNWLPLPTGWTNIGGQFNSTAAFAWSPNNPQLDWHLNNLGLDVFGLGANDIHMWHKSWGNSIDWSPPGTD